LPSPSNQVRNSHLQLRCGKWLLEKVYLVRGESAEVRHVLTCHQSIRLPEMTRTGRYGYNATSFSAMSIPEPSGWFNISNEQGQRTTLPAGVDGLQAGRCLQGGIVFKPEQVTDALQDRRRVVQNENRFHKQPLWFFLHQRRFLRPSPFEDQSRTLTKQSSRQFLKTKNSGMETAPTPLEPRFMRIAT
jgi:hypothetical protein